MQEPGRNQKLATREAGLGAGLVFGAANRRGRYKCLSRRIFGPFMDGDTGPLFKLNKLFFRE